MRSVLITGCSSGFGLSSAVALARKDWRVFATMRNLDKRARLDDALRAAGVADRAEVVQLDVTEPESIQRALKGVLEATGGSLDALVNNAGISHGGFFEDVPEEEWRRIFDTNVFGVMAMTKAVLPVMRQRRSGRIVVVSSESSYYGAPVVSLYHASKWAVEGWAESLHHEVSPFGIRVICVEPGNYATDIWDTSARYRSPESPYDAGAEIMESFVEKTMRKQSRDPTEVASAIVRALEARSPRFRYTVGPDAKVIAAMSRFLPFRLRAAALRRVSGMHRWKP